MKYDAMYAVGAMLAGFGIGQMNPADDGWKTFGFGVAVCLLAVAASIYTWFRDARREKL